MPQSTTAVNSAPRRRVTAVLARFRAGAVDVCKCDQEVALHFSTPQGIVILTVDLAEFVNKCRAPRCHNGHLLPMPGDAERHRAELSAPLPALEQRHATNEEAYFAILADRSREPDVPWAVLCRRHGGVKLSSFGMWRRRHEKATTPRQPGPIPKPGGKLL